MNPKVTLTETIDLPKLMEHFHPHAGKQFVYTITPPVVIERTMVQIQGYIQGSSPMHVRVIFETNNLKHVEALKVECRPESPEWHEDLMQKWVEENITSRIQRFNEYLQDDVLALLEPRPETRRTDVWP